MKCFNNMFKRYAWILILLSSWGYSASLFGMSGDTSGILQGLTDIAKETVWATQIYELNDFLDDDSLPATIDSATQTTLFDLITKIFNGRLDQYKTAMGNNINLADLTLLLTNAQKNTMLSETQRNTITNYQRAVAVEQIVMQNRNEKNVEQQVNNVLSAMGSTGTATFDPLVQSFFMQQLTSLFQARTTLQNASAQDRLNTAFTRAKTSTLIQESNKADVTAKSDILTIESNLRKAAKDTVYGNAVKTVTGLQTQDASKKFEEFTQNLNFSTISQLYNARSGKTAEEITALIGMLTQASTSTLLTAAQQEEIKKMLANLAVQDSVKKAMAQPTFIAKISDMNAVFTANTGKVVSDDTKNQVAAAMANLAGSYPKTDLDAITKLKDLINIALNSTLLNDADKAKLKGQIAQLDADMENAKLAKQLQDILAIQDPKARLAALQKFMAENGSKTLPTDIQKMLQDGIQNLVNSRSKDPAFLSDLAAFVGGLGNSGLLAPDFKTQMSGTLAAINADRDTALLGKALQDILAIQDPKARLAALQKFMAENGSKTLPADIQKMLQDGIQNLVNSRSKDPAFLSDLAAFVGGLGNSGLLAPDFKTQMSGTLAAINTDRDAALLGKALQDILAIQDPKARLAAMQKFMADNAGKTLPTDVQKMLQDGIQGLVSSGSKDPDFLNSLSSLVSGLGNNNLLSADFKTQMASALPGINNDRDAAVLGKSLQDALAIQDPVARLAALQKFMADNPGKTLPADLQKTLQDGITGLTKLGIKDPAFLNGLSGLVGGLGNSTMLTPDFKTLMAGALPGINTDRDAAVLGKSLQDVMAIQDPTARLAALQKFMAENPGKTLPADLQKTLQDGITGLTKLGIKDPAFLNGLSGLVGGLGNSTMLTPDFKTLMASALPGINTDRDGATLGKSLQDIMAIQDPAARLAALQKFMADNPGKTLPADLQKTLQDGINGLTKLGIKDPAFLNGLSGLVGSLGNSTMLTPDFKTMIAGTLPGINTDRDGATLGKSLQDIMAIQDPTARLAALQKFMAENPGKTLPADLQKTLQDGITGLTKLGIKDPAFLNGLSGLVGGLGNSTMLTPDFKTMMASTLPGINTDRDGATLGKSLQDIMAIQDPIARLAALQKFMVENPGKTLPADLQTMLQNGISSLSKLGLKDPAFLSGLSSLASNLGSSSMVSPDFKSQLGKDLQSIGLTDPTMLSKLAGTSNIGGNNLSGDNAALSKTLQDIMAIQDPIARLAALQKFMADNQGKTLPADLQTMLQNGINGLAKSGIKDPAFLAGLSNLVGNLGGSSMVSADFKSQLGKDLQSLGVITDPSILAKLAIASTSLPGAGVPVLGGLTLGGTLQNPNQLGITGIPGATGSTGLSSIDVAKRLVDIANMGDVKLQANALSSFVNDNAGKPLPEYQQQSFNKSLQQALANRGSLDPASLGALATAAQGAAQSGLAGVSGSAVLNQLLPGLKKDADSANLLNGMQRALLESDPNKKIDLVNQVIANAVGKDVTPAAQAQLGQGLQSLIANKPTDPAALGKLAGMLTQAQHLTIIDAGSQQAIKAALPGLAGVTALNANALSLGNTGLTAGSLPGTTSTTLGGLPGTQQAGLGLKPLADFSMPGVAGSTSQPGALGATLTGLKSAQDFKLPGITGATTQATNPLGGNMPGTHQSSTGLKSLADLTMPGVAGSVGQPVATGAALTGLKSTQDFKLPGITSTTPLATNPLGGNMPGTQQAGTGLKPLADLSMPGAQGSAGTAGAALTGLKSVQDLQMPGQHGQANTQGGDATEQALAEELRQAMTLPTLREKMLGVNTVLTKAGNRPFTGALQSAYAEAVQQLFAMRHEVDKQETTTSTTRKKGIRSKTKSAQAKSRKTPATSPNKKKKKKNKKASHAAHAAASITPPDGTAPHPAASGSKKKARRARQ